MSSAEQHSEVQTLFKRIDWKLYLAAASVVAFCSLAGWCSHWLGLTNANVVMIFLAGVAFIAARFGHGPAIAGAILSVLVFDYFFVDPIFSFAPSDAQYFVDLGVMLGIAILISELTARLQAQLRTSQEHERSTAELFRASQERERRTAALYEMSRQLSRSPGSSELLTTAGEQLSAAFGGEVTIYLCGTDQTLQLCFGQPTDCDATEATLKWVAERKRAAGLETENSPELKIRFVPMIGSQRTIGVLGVRPDDAQRFADAEERRMLETCANLIALSIERNQSLAEAQQAQVQVQSEQLRNSLLSSVSHDLRTPLAMIAVTASSLLEGSMELSDPSKRDMLQNVVDESNRVSRQVDNLLDMAQLEAGKIVLKRDWVVLEELVGVAIARAGAELKEHPVIVSIPQDFPLLWVAEELIEQVLINLLDNAVRYTPRHSKIEIQAGRLEDHAEIRFADSGPGLPPGSELKVFDKFFRGNTVVADGQRGIGLGLTICQSIVQAHGGEIRAANRTAGGAEFIISLPCALQSPNALSDESAANDESTAAVNS